MPLQRWMRRAAAGGAMLAAAGAFCAPAQRTFVASYGNDGNTCAVASPCRSFGAAIAKTVAGGELIVLDSAGYGPVTITQSVAIVAPPGVYAGVSVSGTANAGVLVNVPGGVVRLQGLAINALAADNYGIVYQAASKLFVDRVTVSGFGGSSGYGIVTYSTATGHIYLSDVAVRQSHEGAAFISTSGSLAVLIERSTFDENAEGVAFLDNVNATLRDVALRGNSGIGLAASPFDGATAEVECDRCAITDSGTFGVLNGGNSMTATPKITLRHSIVARNDTGIVSEGASSTYCSDTTVTGNVQGVDAVSNGNNYSFADCMVYGNGTNGTLTPLPKQ